MRSPWSRRPGTSPALAPGRCTAPAAGPSQPPAASMSTPASTCHLQTGHSAQTWSQAAALPQLRAARSSVSCQVHACMQLRRWPWLLHYREWPRLTDMAAHGRERERSRAGVQRGADIARRASGRVGCPSSGLVRVLVPQPLVPAPALPRARHLAGPLARASPPSHRSCPPGVHACPDVACCDCAPPPSPSCATRMHAVLHACMSACTQGIFGGGAGGCPLCGPRWAPGCSRCRSL
jgi:hypothetical protein